MSALAKYDPAMLRRMLEKLTDEELAVWQDLVSTCEKVMELTVIADENERRIVELEALCHTLTGAEAH